MKTMGHPNWDTLAALRLMRHSPSEKVRDLASMLEGCRDCVDRCPGIPACTKMRSGARLNRVRVWRANDDQLFAIPARFTALHA
jgi:hypothetical protein